MVKVKAKEAREEKTERAVAKKVKKHLGKDMKEAKTGIKRDKGLIKSLKKIK